MIPLLLLAILLPCRVAADFTEHLSLPSDPHTNNRRAGLTVPNNYIVTLKPGISPPDLTAHLNRIRSVHARSSRQRRDTAGIEKVYTISSDFTAYAGSFDAATLNQILASDDVEAVEPDMIWHLNAPSSPSSPSQSGAPKLTTQSNAPWGLGSISHRAPNQTEYVYNAASSGQGTYAYIVDTGVLASHSEFEGRARMGYNAVPGSSATDNHGHGTHVAGTIGGRSYGVAKKTTLIAVKVFDMGISTTSTVLAGYTWAVNNITASGRTADAVINVSTGGSTSDAFNRAIASAFGSGVLTVAAAGNDGLDASVSSPGSAPEALTVSAVDVSNVRPSWANYGSLVDVFAPGVDVLSAYIGSDTSSALMEGTSAAAPHVAGLALYLKGLDRRGNAAPGDVIARIVGLGTAGVVGDAGSQSPKLLAYNGSGA
ncbi:subtilisin [Echria macrotheca]|uniref:Subtilisin n=1 Tax=Echria macrotheca TaxID=438768 RepID=A0AAJ0BNB0_9PEZI|nr:subtilisin [Echria macrotheca]